MEIGVWGIDKCPDRVGTGNPAKYATIVGNWNVGRCTGKVKYRESLASGGLWQLKCG